MCYCKDTSVVRYGFAIQAPKCESKRFWVFAMSDQIAATSAGAVSALSTLPKLAISNIELHVFNPCTGNILAIH